jgi:hypothetical protein
MPVPTTPSNSMIVLDDLSVTRRGHLVSNDCYCHSAGLAQKSHLSKTDDRPIRKTPSHLLVVSAVAKDDFSSLATVPSVDSSIHNANSRCCFLLLEEDASSFTDAFVCAVNGVFSSNASLVFFFALRVESSFSAKEAFSWLLLFLLERPDKTHLSPPCRLSRSSCRQEHHLSLRTKSPLSSHRGEPPHCVPPSCCPLGCPKERSLVSSSPSPVVLTFLPLLHPTTHSHSCPYSCLTAGETT